MQPLEGIKVLDASNVLAGPMCTMILADFGADVIKVEHPTMGDPLRHHGPTRNERPLWWSMVGRNKRSVTLDLAQQDGQEIFRRLARDADVVVESYRPGRMEAWNLGYAELSQDNPDLVLCRISGFGQKGPYAKRPGFGTLAEAFSGFAFRNGRPEEGPTLPPFGLADTSTGLAAGIAVMVALRARDAGAGGQVIDLSIFEPLMTMLEPQIVVADQLGRDLTRTGNESEMSAPRNLYETADGQWVAISTSTTATAARLMEMVGRPDLTESSWFHMASGRAAHSEVLDEAVSEWISARSRAEVLAACEAAGTPAGPVNSASDLLADPQVQALQSVIEVEDDTLGTVRMPNVLFRLSETPGGIRHPGRELGADTDPVLEQLGLSGEQIKDLHERGVV